MRAIFYLAPMDDVTDIVFRQIIAEAAAPDFFMTEFVNVDGLQSEGRPRLMHKLIKRPQETNLIAQIWGKNPANYEKTANELVGMDFAGIDINMGCPDKTIVKNGCCAAFIENRDLAVDVIRAVKNGVKGRVPVSVKTRLGYNEVDLTWPALLLEQDLDALTIHGRTKKQMSKVPANSDLVGKVRELRDEIAPNTKIIGNGELEKALEGISPRTLSQRLNKLYEEGIVAKHLYCEHPPRYSYYLTEKGTDLQEILSTMADWSAKYREDVC